MRIKRLIQFCLIIVVIILLTKTIFSLGATPGRVDINFKPSLEQSIVYEIFEDNPNKELQISIEGKLAKYIKLSTNKLVGGGKFIVTLNLPNEIETPGKNVIYVRIKEKVDDELVEGAVGTSVSIGAAIIIHVPYPGRYLELNLDSHNVNVGEPVEFKLSVKSQGTETIFMSPVIEILSQDELIETLYFKNREIKSQEQIQLRKVLDTTSYNPGKYNARAIIDYGEIVEAESNFRIGELFIEIINYTEEIVIGGIKAFEISIESGWNNHIDGAYAQVSILENSKPKVIFKTDTTPLTPWERKIVTGHFDTSNFTKGKYDANITLIYFGKEQGRSTSELVEVRFVEAMNITKIMLIILGIIILIAVVFFGKKYLDKKK